MLSWSVRHNPTNGASQMLSERLNPEERQEWTTQLVVLQRGKEHFWATISALALIRKQRLFREEYPSFEAFTRDRMGMSARYASMLIAGAAALDVLGTKVPENLVAKLENPWKLRNLSGLTTDQMVEVVNHAESCSGGGEITSTMIAASKRIVMGIADSDDATEDQETVEQSEEMQAFQDALAEIDSVDALAMVLESFGPIPEQCMILCEVQPELCEAIRAI
jgi:hypothetical protein